MIELPAARHQPKRPESFLCPFPDAPILTPFLFTRDTNIESPQRSFHWH
jgi:hypothetical protein